jgi:hypothetical protein
MELGKVFVPFMDGFGLGCNAFGGPVVVVDRFAVVATFVTVVDGFGLVCNALNGSNSFLELRLVCGRIWGCCDPLIRLCLIHGPIWACL